MIASASKFWTAWMINMRFHRRGKIIAVICLLVVTMGVANFIFRFVEYRDSIVSLRWLQNERESFHCVQKPVSPPLEPIAGFLAPNFICFDTLAEADMWMRENL